VGSEMCIRDRCEPGLFVFFWANVRLAAIKKNITTKANFISSPSIYINPILTCKFHSNGKVTKSGSNLDKWRDLCNSREEAKKVLFQIPFLFAYSGLAPWTFFSTSVTQ